MNFITGYKAVCCPSKCISSGKHLQYSVLTDYSHGAEVQSHSVEQSVTHCRIIISASTVLTSAAIMRALEGVIQPRRKKKNKE